jgi:hypothetical protein
MSKVAALRSTKVGNNSTWFALAVQSCPSTIVSRSATIVFNLTTIVAGVTTTTTTKIATTTNVLTTTTTLDYIQLTATNLMTIEKSGGINFPPVSLYSISICTMYSVGKLQPTLNQGYDHA